MTSNMSRFAQGFAYLGASIAIGLGRYGTWMKDSGFDTAFAGLGYHVFTDYFKLILPEKYAKMTSAAFTFTGCCTAECIQAMEIPLIKNHPDWIGSVYDPKDFAAYAIGVGSAYGIDLLLERISNRKTPSSLEDVS
ncbi:MAG: hypothetical protein AABX70_02410 [Nanoarchaeota archaeon]